MSDVEEVLHQQLSLMHSAKVNISAWYRAKHVCPRERLVYRLWQKHLGPPDGLQPRSQNQKTENDLCCIEVSNVAHDTVQSNSLSIKYSVQRRFYDIFI